MTTTDSSLPAAGAVLPAELRLGRQLVLAFTAILVTVAAATLHWVPYGRAIWDYLFLLNGSYRIGLGQVPHVDFASPVGALSLYLTYAAERLFPNGVPFVGLHALAWLLMLPPLVALAPRLRSGWAFAAALALLAVMVLVPVTVDSTHLSEISFFASYNRFATGLLFLLGLWFVLPKSRSDWALLAYILAVLFFLKITAALLAFGLVGAALVLGRLRWTTPVATLAAFAVVLVAVNFRTGLVVGYVHDVAAMAGVNRGGLVYAIAYTGFHYWAPLAAVAVLLVLPIAGLRHSGFVTQLRGRLADSLLVDVALLVGLALLAESQNTGGIGLVAAVAVFFHPTIWQQQDRRRLVALSMLLIALVLPLSDTIIQRLIIGVGRERVATSQPIEALMPGLRVRASTAEGAKLFSRMRDQWLPLAREVSDAGFYLDPEPTSNAPATRLAWANSAVDAANIFRAENYGALASRYTTIAFTDPFARLLHLTPAEGTNIVIDVGRTMPTLTEAGADHYLATSDGVFVDRCSFSPMGNEDVFAAVLKREFTEAPLNDCWGFYHRTSPSTAG